MFDCKRKVLKINKGKIMQALEAWGQIPSSSTYQLYAPRLVS